jgi:hypothetical protein
MCFSASASFISAACIASLGVVAQKKAIRKVERPFAWIPFLFALQQVFEGSIWYSFNHPQYASYQSALTVAFLFFAWVVWPILVPWASYKVEPNEKRKRFFKLVFFLGGIVGVVSIIQLIFNNPEAYITQGRIAYRFTSMHFLGNGKWVLQGIYVLVTLVPLLLSSVRGVVILGITNIVALIVSFLYFKEALPSVWCFFAALLSILIVAILPITTPVTPLEKLH